MRDSEGYTEPKMIPIILVAIAKVLCIYLMRIMYLLRPNQSATPTKQHSEPTRTMIILGSGGHTTEMLALTKALNKKLYTPRIYVLAATDTTSEPKVLALEKDVSDAVGNYQIIRIGRSRYVGQSYVSAVFTTLHSIWQCVPLVYGQRPDLILCNGPGTCVPICLVTFLLKVFFINTACKMVFVESYCRVNTISLSGKILLRFVDSFIVQWPQLLQTAKGTKVHYFGRLL